MGIVVFAFRFTGEKRKKKRVLYGEEDSPCLARKRAAPRRLHTHTFGAPGVARCLVVHATRDDVAVSAPHADLKKLALSQFRYTNAMVAGNVTGTSNA